MLGFIGIAMLAAAAHQSRRSLAGLGGTADQHSYEFNQLLWNNESRPTEMTLARLDQEARWFKLSPDQRAGFEKMRSAVYGRR